MVFNGEAEDEDVVGEAKEVEEVEDGFDVLRGGCMFDVLDVLVVPVAPKGPA